MENQGNYSANPGAHLNEDQASVIQLLAHLSLNPGQGETGDRNADEIQAKVNDSLSKSLEDIVQPNGEENSRKKSRKLKNQKNHKAFERERKQRKNRRPSSPFDFNNCINPWKSRKMMIDTIKKDSSHNDYNMIIETRLLLNKLNNENFHCVSKQFYSKDLNEDNLAQIFEMLFIKASAEGIFVEGYADMIQNISERVSSKEDMSTSNSKSGLFIDKIELKNIILLSIDTGVKNLLEHVTHITSRTSESDIIDDIEYRDNLTNSLMFIAALFKRNFIGVEQVLNICLNLMEKPSEPNLEILAVFLMKIGEKIDDTIKKMVDLQWQWDRVLENIEILVSNRSLSKKKTHFKLLDFIELKNRAWIPRAIHISEPMLTPQGLIDQEKRKFKEVKNKKDISQFYTKELQYLNVTQQPWRRGCFKCKSFVQEPLVSHMVMMILNTINETNFDHFYSKFARKCRFKTETIDKCVDMVLDKCLQDSKYIGIYIELVKLYGTHKSEDHIMSKKRSSDLDGSVFVSLLVKKSIQMITGTHQKSLEYSGTQNICLVISELFNSNMIGPIVLLDLLLTLLSQGEEQKLIYAAKILLLCGKLLEKSAAENMYEREWENIGTQIQIISSRKRGELSNRTYLLLTSVFKLRNRKWKSKAINIGNVHLSVNAKKIIQRHQHVSRKEREEKSAEKRSLQENLLQTREDFLVKDILKDLDMVDNPWRRGEFKRELTESEKTTMEAKTLLNKLAENNFKLIVEQFAKLKFTSDTLDPILNVLFVKAILETKFTELHAKFVKSVSDLLDPRNQELGDTDQNLKTADDKLVFDLKGRIIEKCVMEIDSINADCSFITDEIKHQKRAKLATDTENVLDNVPLDFGIGTVVQFKKRSCKKDKSDCFLSEHYREVLKKKISVGTCHFLGELFNTDVLHVNFILTTLLYNLLPYEGEESIECGIKLISIVGKKLERVISRTGDENCEAGWNLVMENISSKAAQENQGRWSNRIYFMLLDLIDLRQRDWLPRIIIVPTRQFRVPKKAQGI